jgi:hypothetical protein
LFGYQYALGAASGEGGSDGLLEDWAEEDILFRDLSPDFVDNYLPKSHVGRPKVRSAINTFGAEWDNYDNG